VDHAPRDEVFFSRHQWNPLRADDQRVAALDHHHVLIAVVSVRRGWRAFATGPKRHLASVNPIEDVTLDARSRLIGFRDPVGGIFHEFGKIVHGRA